MINKNSIPYQFGQIAFRNNIKAASHDINMMDYIKNNTSGKIGSSLELLTEYNNGYYFEANKATEKELKLNFPEMYGN